MLLLFRHIRIEESEADRQDQQEHGPKADDVVGDLCNDRKMVFDESLNRTSENQQNQRQNADQHEYDGITGADHPRHHVISLLRFSPRSMLSMPREADQMAAIAVTDKTVAGELV